MVVLIINNSSKKKIKKRTKTLIKIVQNYGFSTIIISSNTELNQVLSNEKNKIKGIILGGGPLQLSEKICINDISQNLSVLLNFAKIPILGICFGMQVMTIAYGGTVENLKNEFKHKIGLTCHDKKSLLFDGIKEKFNTYEYHYDYVTEIPHNFNIIAKSDDNIIYGMENTKLKRWAVQFHPECLKDTRKIIYNFLSFL
jgi:anthranilate/para-aminobenzoate synthase component II